MAFLFAIFKGNYPKQVYLKSTLLTQSVKEMKLKWLLYIDPIQKVDLTAFSI